MPGAWETHVWAKEAGTNKYQPLVCTGGKLLSYMLAIDAHTGSIHSLAGCNAAVQFSNLATKLQVAITDDNSNPLGMKNRPLLAKDSIQLNFDYRAEPTGAIVNSAVMIIDNATHSSFTYLLNSGAGAHAELASLIISNTSQTDAWLKLYANITGAKEIARFFCPKNDTRVYGGGTALVFTYQNEDLVVAAESNVDSLYVNCHVRYFV